MAIEQFYTPKKPLYPPKQISGYAPDHPGVTVENYGCFDNVVVGHSGRALDLWSRGREFDCRPVHCRVALVNSAFQFSVVGKSSTGLLAGVKVGRVHLCQVTGNIVWSHMARDVP